MDSNFSKISSVKLMNSTLLYSLKICINLKYPFFKTLSMVLFSSPDKGNLHNGHLTSLELFKNLFVL